MSISEEKQSPPGGPAVEHQKIGMPPRQNFQQNPERSHAYATTDLGAMSAIGGTLLFGGDKSAQTTMVVSDSVTEADLVKACNDLLWGASPVMTDDLPSKRLNCSTGLHDWDTSTQACRACGMGLGSYLLEPASRAYYERCQQQSAQAQRLQNLQPTTVNTVPLNQSAHILPSHWVYPTSRYAPSVQKISQQQTTDATVETEAAKLRREVARLSEECRRWHGSHMEQESRIERLEAQNRAQASLIASMSGDQFPDTDGLFKARVESSAVAAVDEPVNVEKAAQDTLDAMVARKLSRGMTEKLRDTAVESLRKGDRDASVGRAIGVRFGGGLRQPW